jgi:hypothetical protein
LNAGVRDSTALARTHDKQVPDRFDHASGVLRDSGALAGQDLAGSGFGIDGLGLAATGTGMGVRPVDLNHPMCSVLCSESTATEKSEFIDSQKLPRRSTPTLSSSCAVSTSGFYEWGPARNRSPQSVVII